MFATHLGFYLRKYFDDYPAGLAKPASSFEFQNVWAQCLANPSVLAQAEPGYDILSLMTGLADVAVVPAKCIQDVPAYLLKHCGVREAEGLNALITYYGNGMRELVHQDA